MMTYAALVDAQLASDLPRLQSIVSQLNNSIKGAFLNATPGPGDPAGGVRCQSRFDRFGLVSNPIPVLLEVKLEPCALVGRGPTGA
jgi:hypothetical protein